MVDIREEEVKEGTTAPTVVKEEGHIVYTVEVKEGEKWNLFKTVNKEGKSKIARAETKKMAVTIRNNILDKEDIEAARIVYGTFAKGGFVPKRTEEEVTKEQRVDDKKNEIPEDLIELYGKERAEQLQYMDEHERGAVLHLLKQLRAKQEELSTFGILAAQRSAFRKDPDKPKTLEKLKKDISKSKEEYSDAKERYETAITTGKEFAEGIMKDLPHLYKWVVGELGITQTNISTKTRRRTGTGAENSKKALIYKMFNTGEGKGKRLNPKDIAKIMAEKNLDGDWKQTSISNPIAALKADGYLSEDDQERYYIS